MDSPQPEQSAIEAQLPREPTSPGLARATLKAVAHVRRIPAEKLETATLLLSELVSNAVLHGEPEGPIELRVRLDGSRVRASVWNAGEWFDARAPRDPTEIGGWGLDLVDTLAADWGTRYADPGVEVWFEV